MATIKPLGGVIMEYDTVSYYSDGGDPEYGDVVAVSHLCYRDYEEMLKDLEWLMDEAGRDTIPSGILPHSPTSKVVRGSEWRKTSAEPEYPVFCTVCEDMLDIEPIMCCEKHRYRDWSESKSATQNMIDMIRNGGYLCPYYTILALKAEVLNETQIRAIVGFGKRHIPLFANTPAGLLLVDKQGGNE